MRLNFLILSVLIFLAGCATSAPGPQVNMSDPATYVKVNFLKGNYDEVIRYGSKQGVLNEKNDRLKILYYVGLSQLEKNDFNTARKTFELLKERDSAKNYQDLADVRIADSYFLEQKYRQAYQLYEPLPRKYSKSTLLPYIYYRLVLSAQKIGDFEASKTYYQALNRQYPESFEAMRLVNVLDPMDLEGFSVQVGSFSDSKKARGVQVTLLSKGFIASVNQIRKDNLTYYRVRVHASSRAEAESIAARLRAQGYAAKVYP
jgi:tetratricopeptide (TPR) repeat protein